MSGTEREAEAGTMLVCVVVAALVAVVSLAGGGRNRVLCDRGSGRF